MSRQFNLKKAWKEIRKGLGIEKVQGDLYIGAMRVKDVRGIVDEVMDEWVQRFEHKRDFTGLRKRFITYQEFQEIFNDTLIERIEGTVESKKESNIREKEQRKERRKQKYKAKSGKLEEKLDKAMLRGVLNKLDSGSVNDGVRGIYRKFFQKYPVFALFNVRNEMERQQYARLLKAPNRYFHVMASVNKTLGDFFLKWRRFSLSENARKKHTYIVAMTGEGKSELTKSLARFDILKGESGIILIDPNGDFAQEVAQFKDFIEPKHRERLVYIDPFLEKGYTPVINPFEPPIDNTDNQKFLNGFKTEDFKIQGYALDVFEILKQILTESNVNLTANMELILLNTIPVLCHRPNSTLMDLYRFMDDKRNEDLIEYGKNMSDEIVSSFFRNDYNTTHIKSAKQGVKLKLSKLLSSGKFRDLVCGKTTLNLYQEMMEKKIIIFNLSKGKLKQEPSQIYGQFILNQILTIASLQVFVPKNKRLSFHIYIDEFHNYKSKTLQVAFQEGRKFGIHLTVATQVVGQQLTTEMSKAIMGNTNIKIVGGAGKDTRSSMAKEMELAKQASELSGVNEDTLSKLGVGEFVVTIGRRKAFQMMGRQKTLNTFHSMSDQKWEQLKQSLLQKYYRKDGNDDDTKGNDGDNTPVPDLPIDTTTKKKLNLKYDV